VLVCILRANPANGVKQTPAPQLLTCLLYGNKLFHVSIPSAILLRFIQKTLFFESKIVENKSFGEILQTAMNGNSTPFRRHQNRRSRLKTAVRVLPVVHNAHYRRYCNPTPL
jgi:hypothetical protein